MRQGLTLDANGNITGMVIVTNDSDIYLQTHDNLLIVPEDHKVFQDKNGWTVEQLQEPEPELKQEAHDGDAE